MPPPLIARCGGCHYFERMEPLKPMGKCHRNPPTAAVVGMIKHPITGASQAVSDSFWTLIPDSEWCGQWEVRLSGRVELNLEALTADAIEGTA